MQVRMWFLSFVLCVVACGGDAEPVRGVGRRPRATPEATFRELVRAVNADEHRALYDMLTVKARVGFEEDLDSLRNTVESGNRLEWGTLELFEEQFGISLVEFVDLPADEACWKYATRHMAIEKMPYRALKGAKFVRVEPLVRKPSVARVYFTHEGVMEATYRVLMARENGTWGLHSYKGVSLTDNALRTPLGPCAENLERIAALLRKRRDEGRLQALEGRAFLLQVSADVPDENLGIFCCASDPLAPGRNTRESLHCSFRGPSLQTAIEFVGNRLRSSAILACETNGKDGRQPFHRDGVVVLWSYNKVEFIWWPLMEGFEGVPVPIGPDSPDPRFRHLVP